MNHLPVYFVVDCSGTMVGEKITSVKRGVEKICKTLGQDPRSANTIRASVIWFNDMAHRTPLVPIATLRLPDTLSAIGKTALGAALDELNRALDSDFEPGDSPPVVFLMTDGKPTDDWEAAAARYKARTNSAPLHTIGLAIGADASTTIISQIADVVMEMNAVTPEALASYFDWMGDSVVAIERKQADSRSIDPYRTIVLRPAPITIHVVRDVTGAIPLRPDESGNDNG